MEKMGVPIAEVLVVARQLVAAQGVAVHVVLAVPVELAGGRVDGELDVATRLEPRRLNGLDDELERLLVGLQVRGEAALVADGGVEPAALAHALQGVEDLDAHAEALGEGGRAHGHDHELLEVHVVVRVLAAVEDVHHRHGQHVGGGAAEVAVEREAALVRRRVGVGEGDGQDGVGAQPALVLRAVQLDHRAVHRTLVEGVLAGEAIGDLAVDVLHRLEDALTAVPALAVSELVGLVDAGAGARGHGRAAVGSRGEEDLRFEGRVTARVQDLASVNADDFAHAADPKVMAAPRHHWRVISWPRCHLHRRFPGGRSRCCRTH